MLRFLLLALLAALPLVASAHGGHAAPSQEAAPAPIAAIAPSGAIVAIVSAPSRCPGGEENCCCHDAACTPSFQPLAIDAPSIEAALLRSSGETGVDGTSNAPRTVALFAYPPRGPPARS